MLAVQPTTVRCCAGAVGAGAGADGAGSRAGARPGVFSQISDADFWVGFLDIEPDAQANGRAWPSSAQAPAGVWRYKELEHPTAGP